MALVSNNNNNNNSERVSEWVIKIHLKVEQTRRPANVLCVCCGDWWVWFTGAQPSRRSNTTKWQLMKALNPQHGKNERKFCRIERSRKSIYLFIFYLLKTYIKSLETMTMILILLVSFGSSLLILLMSFFQTFQPIFFFFSFNHIASSSDALQS